MESLKRILTFLRITDEHDNKLSLTNIALIVVLIKLVMSPNASIVEVVPLFIALAAYSAKKVINKDAAEPSADGTQLAAVETEVEEIKSRLTSISLSLGIKNLKG
jgi:hypothetical protein